MVVIVQNLHKISDFKNIKTITPEYKNVLKLKKC